MERADQLTEVVNFLFGTTMLVFLTVISVITLVVNWKIFVKAGQPGWASLVPLYNVYIQYKITWGEGVWCLLLLIPFARWVVAIITCVKMSQVFGKGTAFALGLIFLRPIFVLILAFDRSQYLGVQASS